MVLAIARGEVHETFPNLWEQRSLQEIRLGPLVRRAGERLVRELLPVLDDLERALEAAAQHEEAQLEEGVRLVHRSLADALTKEGLSEIDTDGAFDPHTQEALLSQPSEAEEGSVIQVLQKGYKLGDRVLRPARVVISGGNG
jgi:molecular chaperone GrpE